MKSRLIGILLSLCMVLALLPMQVGAETQLPWESEPDK